MQYKGLLGAGESYNLFISSSLVKWSKFLNVPLAAFVNTASMPLSASEMKLLLLR